MITTVFRLSVVAGLFFWSVTAAILIDLKPILEWKHLEFDYVSKEERQIAIDSGEFILTNPFPLDVDVHDSGNETKIFVSIPRFTKGIPATFGTVSHQEYEGNRVISPYPSWSWHQNLTDCPTDRIVSVFRMKIDNCGRLWVMDTGTIEFVSICPPQILIFDIETNQLIRRYEIPKSQRMEHSLFVQLAIDIRKPDETCDNSFAYIADCKAFTLLIYDFARNTSWKITDKSFYPYPSFGTFHISGYSYELMDGIMGMDLSPYTPGNDRILFYYAISSATQNWVYTSHIRNETNFINNPNSSPHIFHGYRRQRTTQASPFSIDNKGISYFGLNAHNSLNCWNTGTDYKMRNIAVFAKNRTNFQYTSNVKIIDRYHGQELWAVSTAAERTVTGVFNISKINARIFAINLNDLIKCRR